MQLFQNEVRYNHEHGDPEEMLRSVLNDVYSNKTLVDTKMSILHNTQDRKRLLKYLDNPNIKNPHKFIELFYQYRVTMQMPEIKKIYMTNNFNLLDSLEDQLLLQSFVETLKTKVPYKGKRR